MNGLPTVALSIQQPWSWLIVNGHKDIENRSWPTRFRGPALIHAGKKIDTDALDPGEWVQSLVEEHRLAKMSFETGGIVGVAEIVDCVSSHPSPWFCGDYGFVLSNARPLPFMPLRGALGFFKATYEAPR